MSGCGCGGSISTSRQRCLVFARAGELVCGEAVAGAKRPRLRGGYGPSGALTSQERRGLKRVLLLGPASEEDQDSLDKASRVLEEVHSSIVDEETAASFQTAAREGVVVEVSGLRWLRVTLSQTQESTELAKMIIKKYYQDRLRRREDLASNGGVTPCMRPAYEDCKQVLAWRKEAEDEMGDAGTVAPKGTMAAPPSTEEGKAVEYAAQMVAKEMWHSKKRMGGRQSDVSTAEGVMEFGVAALEEALQRTRGGEARVPAPTDPVSHHKRPKAAAHKPVGASVFSKRRQKGKESGELRPQGKAISQPPLHQSLQEGGTLTAQGPSSVSQRANAGDSQTAPPGAVWETPCGDAARGEHGDCSSLSPRPSQEEAFKKAVDTVRMKARAVKRVARGAAASSRLNHGLGVRVTQDRRPPPPSFPPPPPKAQRPSRWGPVSPPASLPEAIDSEPEGVTSGTPAPARKRLSMALVPSGASPRGTVVWSVGQAFRQETASAGDVTPPAAAKKDRAAVSHHSLAPQVLRDAAVSRTPARKRSKPAGSSRCSKKARHGNKGRDGEGSPVNPSPSPSPPIVRPFGLVGKSGTSSPPLTESGEVEIVEPANPHYDLGGGVTTDLSPRNHPRVAQMAQGAWLAKKLDLLEEQEQKKWPKPLRRQAARARFRVLRRDALMRVADRLYAVAKTNRQLGRLEKDSGRNSVAKAGDLAGEILPGDEVLGVREARRAAERAEVAMTNDPYLSDDPDGERAGRTKVYMDKLHLRRSASVRVGDGTSNESDRHVLVSELCLCENEAAWLHRWASGVGRGVPAAAGMLHSHTAKPMPTCMIGSEETSAGTGEIPAKAQARRGRRSKVNVDFGTLFGIGVSRGSKTLPSSPPSKTSTGRGEPPPSPPSKAVAGASKRRGGFQVDTGRNKRGGRRGSSFKRLRDTSGHTASTPGKPSRPSHPPSKKKRALKAHEAQRISPTVITLPSPSTEMALDGEGEEVDEIDNSQSRAALFLLGEHSGVGSTHAGNFSLSLSPSPMQVASGLGQSVKASDPPLSRKRPRTLQDIAREDLDNDLLEWVSQQGKTHPRSGGVHVAQVDSLAQRDATGKQSWRPTGADTPQTKPAASEADLSLPSPPPEPEHRALTPPASLDLDTQPALVLRADSLSSQQRGANVPESLASPTPELNLAPRSLLSAAEYGQAAQTNFLKLHLEEAARQVKCLRDELQETRLRLCKVEADKGAETGLSDAPSPVPSVSFGAGKVDSPGSASPAPSGIEGTQGIPLVPSSDFPLQGSITLGSSEVDRELGGTPSADDGSDQAARRAPAYTAGVDSPPLTPSIAPLLAVPSPSPALSGTLAPGDGTVSSPAEGGACDGSQHGGNISPTLSVIEEDKNLDDSWEEGVARDELGRPMNLDGPLQGGVHAASTAPAPNTGGAGEDHETEPAPALPVDGNGRGGFTPADTPPEGKLHQERGAKPATSHSAAEDVLHRAPLAPLTGAGGACAIASGIAGAVLPGRPSVSTVPLDSLGTVGFDADGNRIRASEVPRAINEQQGAVDIRSRYLAELQWALSPDHRHSLAEMVYPNGGHSFRPRCLMGISSEFVPLEPRKAQATGSERHRSGVRATYHNLDGVMCSVAALRALGGPLVVGSAADAACLSHSSRMSDMLGKAVAAWPLMLDDEYAAGGHSDEAIIVRAIRQTPEDGGIVAQCVAAVAAAENLIGGVVSTPSTPDDGGLDARALDLRTLQACAVAINAGHKLRRPPTQCDAAGFAPTGSYRPGPLLVKSWPAITTEDVDRCRVSHHAPAGSAGAELLDGVATALGIVSGGEGPHGHVVLLLIDHGPAGWVSVVDPDSRRFPTRGDTRTGFALKKLSQGMKQHRLAQILRLSDVPSSHRGSSPPPAPTKFEDIEALGLAREKRVAVALAAMASEWKPAVASWESAGLRFPTWLVGTRTHTRVPSFSPLSATDVYLPGRTSAAWRDMADGGKLGPFPHLVWKLRTRVVRLPVDPLSSQSTSSTRSSTRVRAMRASEPRSKSSRGKSILTAATAMVAMAGVPPAASASAPTQADADAKARRAARRDRASRRQRKARSLTLGGKGIGGRSRRNAGNKKKSPLKGGSEKSSDATFLSKVSFVSWNTNQRASGHLAAMLTCITNATSDQPEAALPDMTQGRTIIAISEPGGSKSLNAEPYGLQCFRPEFPERPKGRSMAALLVSGELEPAAIPHSVTGCDGRTVVWVSIPSHPRPLAVASVYIPVHTTGVPKSHPSLPPRDMVIEQLVGAVGILQQSHSIVLMGDFNTHIGDTENPGWAASGWVNGTALSPPSPGVDRLIALCESASLVPAHSAGTATYPGSGRLLDYILVPSSQKQSCTRARNCTVYTRKGAGILKGREFSDHSLISVTLKLNLSNTTVSQVAARCKRQHVPPSWSVAQPAGRETWQLYRTLISSPPQGGLPVNGDPYVDAQHGQEDGHLLQQPLMPTAPLPFRGSASDLEEHILDCAVRANEEYKARGEVAPLVAAMKTSSADTRRAYAALKTIEKLAARAGFLDDSPKWETAEGAALKLEISQLQKAWRAARRAATRAATKLHCQSERALASKLKDLMVADPGEAHRIIKSLTGKSGPRSRALDQARTAEGVLVSEASAVLAEVRMQMAGILSPKVLERSGTVMARRLRALLPISRPTGRTSTGDPLFAPLPPPSPPTATVEEVESAIRGLKHNKSPGPSPFRGEHVRYAGPHMVEAVHSLINRLLSEDEAVPDSWHVGVGTLIGKKGTVPGLATTMRLVVSRPPLAKVFNTILKVKLEKATEWWMSPEQAGFSAGRGTQEHILALVEGTKAYLQRAVLSHEKDDGIPSERKPALCIVLVFIDFVKAFDSASHDAMETILRNAGIHPILQRRLAEYIRLARVTVTTAYGETDSISVTRGVPQGGVLSPLLFKIAVDMVCRALRIGYEPGDDPDAAIRDGEQHMPGIPLHHGDPIGARLHLLAYADDICSICRDEKEANKCIRIVRRVGQLMGLDINPAKSGIVILAATSPEQRVRSAAQSLRTSLRKSLCNVRVNGRPIPVRNEYEYLGVQVVKMVQVQASRGEKVARDKLIPPVHATVSLAKARWVDLETKRRLLESTTLSAAGYQLAITSRASLLPVRHIDQPVALHTAWAWYGLHTRLLNFPYPAIMRSIGLRQTHASAMRSRVLMSLRLAKNGRVDSPAFAVLMRSILDSQSLFPSLVGAPAATLLQLDGNAATLTGAEAGWRLPWAARMLGELCLIGLHGVSFTLMEMADKWANSTPSLSSSLAPPGLQSLRQTLPTTSKVGPSITTAVTPSLSATTCLEESPDMPTGQWTVMERLDIIESWMAVAGSRRSTAHHPRMKAADRRRPKAYHLGDGAATHAWLHPIPRAPSPALWACGTGSLLARKVIMLQTGQVLHGLERDTKFAACPLCGLVSPPPEKGMLLHVIMVCSYTRAMRGKALSKLCSLLLPEEEPLSHVSPHLSLLKTNTGEATPTELGVVPPPLPLLRALRSHRSLSLSQDGDDDGLSSVSPPDMMILYRALMCGQWPTGSTELTGICPTAAAVYTFPHRDSIKVHAPAPQAAEAQAAEQAGPDQEHLSRTPSMSRVRACPAWKDVILACSKFCGAVYDLLMPKMLLGVQVRGGRHRREVSRAAGFVDAAVTGRASPPPLATPTAMDRLPGAQHIQSSPTTGQVYDQLQDPVRCNPRAVAARPSAGDRTLMSFAGYVPQTVTVGTADANSK